MKFLIVLAVAVGIANASPAVFLQNTPDVQTATLQFLREYNRLAKLAADAPDIHIYHDDKLQRVQPAAQTHRLKVANPLQGFPFYSFTANLGTQQQFRPHQMTRSFAQVQHAPVQRHVQPVQRHVQPVTRQVQHAPRQHVIVRNVQPAQPVQRWTGPMADTEPAGVRGLPTDVTPTPEVAAARKAHFAVLVDAYQRAALQRQQNVV